MTDGYAPRTPAQLLWLGLAAALVATLVGGGGWLAWRGVSESAPTLSAPSGADAPASASAPDVMFGAPELVNGVPWSFPLTPAGAAAAGTTAVAVTGQPDAVFDPARFAEVAEVVFTAEEAATQARQVDAARTEFELSGWADQPPSRRTYFFAPLAVRLVTYDAAAPSAQLEVWAISVVGVGDAGGAVFTTSTVDLVAADGAWTVTRLDSAQGPTPLVQAVASAPGRTRGWLRQALPTVPLPLPAQAEPKGGQP